MTWRSLLSSTVALLASLCLADRICADDIDLYIRNISAQEAKALEQKVKENPEDLDSRKELIGYYFSQGLRSTKAKQERHRHVLWMIQNHPSLKISGDEPGFYGLDPVLDGQAYEEAKRIWLEQVKTHPDNPEVLLNAARFFYVHDTEQAEKLFRQGQTLEPNEPRWPLNLAGLYLLGLSNKPIVAKRTAAVKASNEWDQALKLITEDEDRFRALTSAATAAFEAGDRDKASRYGDEVLQKAPEYKNAKSYWDSIHRANLILGRVALSKGDLEKARSYLVAAGRVEATGPLSTFGPNMALAKELLEKGEREVVLKYLDECRAFWYAGHDGDLNKWVFTIESGGLPDFGANLDY